MVDAGDGGRGRWEGIAADELLGMAMVIADPETLDNLLPAVPDTDEVPEVEARYDTIRSGTGPVRCRHCKKNAANHWRGFVLAYRDGRRILIGKNCGKKQFKQNWANVQRAFDAAMDQRYYLLRKQAALGAAPQLREHLEAVLGHSSLSAYRDVFDGYRRHMPLLHGVLSNHLIRHGGRLMIEARVRDRAAEDEAIDRRDREIARARREGAPVPPPLERKPIYKVEERPFGVMSAPDFFREGTARPPRDLPAVVNRIENALGTLPGLTSTGDLRSFFKVFGEYLTEVAMQLQLLAALPSALSDENLLLLADWTARRALPGTYRARPGQLIFENPDEGATHILAVPADFVPPAGDFLEAFRSTLDRAAEA